MRDIALTIVVVVLLASALRRPWIGALTCVWLGYMSPHRMCFGFASALPFVAVATGVTVFSIVANRDARRLPWTWETFLLLAFAAWISFTMLFALNPEEGVVKWERSIKSLSLAALSIVTLSTYGRIRALVWTIVLSLGFFGVKGGLFAIATGGHAIVQGPSGSLLENNNALAILLAASLPLLRYLQATSVRASMRWALGGAGLLTVCSVLASYSRGGFLALCIACLLMWLHGTRKILVAGAVLAALPLVFVLMPAKWFDRIESIQNYQEDGSARGRLNAWKFAWNLALDRPLTGGGFRAFTPEAFATYAPNPQDFHDAHSIYFEALGEHGFPGLLLFLSLGISTFRSAKKMEKAGAANDDMRYLLQAVRASLLTYAVGGATSTLAYADLPYHLVAIVIVSKSILREKAAEETAVAVEA